MSFLKVSFFLFTFSLFLFTGLFAQEAHPQDASEYDNKEKPFFVFNEGVTVSWLTRIINQTGRSNFVYKDFLTGLYFSTELHNIKHVVPALRIALYYPLTSTFNDFPQFPNNPLQFGVDFNLGIKLRLFDFDYVRVNTTPALHILTLTSDRWNYLNAGAGLAAGLELPLTKKFTLLINGIASLDNGNLGSNGSMEPFDITYQYQLDIGVRYSKKMPNNTVIFPAREKGRIL